MTADVRYFKALGMDVRWKIFIYGGVRRAEIVSAEQAMVAAGNRPAGAATSSEIEQFAYQVFFVFLAIAFLAITMQRCILFVAVLAAMAACSWRFGGTIDQFVEFVAIQPYATAMRAVVDFYPMSIRREQAHFAAAWTFHYLYPRCLPAIQGWQGVSVKQEKSAAVRSFSACCGLCIQASRAGRASCRAA
jgi:hypothetical protein